MTSAKNNLHHFFFHAYFISIKATMMMKKATGSDSKFFTTNRKGENHELREELRSPQRDRKRDAVKKVIIQIIQHLSLYVLEPTSQLFLIDYFLLL